MTNEDTLRNSIEEGVVMSSIFGKGAKLDYNGIKSKWLANNDGIKLAVEQWETCNELWSPEFIYQSEDGFVIFDFFIVMFGYNVPLQSRIVSMEVTGNQEKLISDVMYIVNRVNTVYLRLYGTSEW